MSKEKIYWAGFVDNRIATDTVIDGYGEHGTPAIFITKREAREQYHDVRKVIIAETI